MSEHPICGKCGTPILNQHGARHFGHYTAHQEYECLAILRAKIDALEAALRAELMVPAVATLRELDRLYRLRFEIAEREKAGVDCKKELRVYGEQKKSAWAESAKHLAAIDAAIDAIAEGK